MNNLSFSNFPLTPAITALLGGLVAILLERYKNRIVTLTHTISFQSLGSEINDPYWGTTSISHNSRNIKHLSFIEVTIKNTTRNDAQGPLNLEIWVDNNSKILGHRGHYDTGNAIQFEDKFHEQYLETLRDIETDNLLRLDNNEHIMPEDLSRRIDFFLANRKLALPIFNRKSSLTIHFLVENLEGLTPKMKTTILHKGLKLIPEIDKTKADNYKKIFTGLITLVFCLIGYIWVFNHYPTKQDAIAWTIAIGSGSYILGYGSYSILMFLKKVFW